VKKEQYNVAIVGATGAVGEQMREVLQMGWLMREKIEQMKG
jgi:aspartate-semialdehyde dehydrogenase